MILRDQNIARLSQESFDVLVVGGGINGAVSIAAAAARGARAALIERGDFASGTSQESSNLVWGGIKYLESYEFALVRDLCLSRNRLLQSYPSTVREMRFLATVDHGFRHPPFLLWLGTWAYWLFGNCFTRPPRRLSRRRLEREEPGVRTRKFAGAMEYSDAYLFDNDARFVFNFVRTALDAGAAAANYCESTQARRVNGHWHTQVRDVVSGHQFTVHSRALINACGPFADQHNVSTGESTQYRHVFSKGIHLLVDTITPSGKVLAFFADDGRLFFAIPMGAKTCLGTTDVGVEEPSASVTDDDRHFVLDNINARLNLPRTLGLPDIIAERCGVRPLVVSGDDVAQSDFLQLSRRHQIEVNVATSHLTVFGGKLTDSINVGEEVCARLCDMGIELEVLTSPWYGEAGNAARGKFMDAAVSVKLDGRAQAGSTEPLSKRLWRRYGASAQTLIHRIEADPREAETVLQDSAMIRGELHLMREREMVVTLEDFLRRRTNLALTQRHAALAEAAGMDEVCALLFGSDGARRKAEYFRLGR